MQLCIQRKLKNIIQNSNLIMWFSNLKWQPIEEWNIQNKKQTKTTWKNLSIRQASHSPWIYICSSNWVKKWFNSKLNPEYSLKIYIIFHPLANPLRFPPSHTSTLPLSVLWPLPLHYHCCLRCLNNYYIILNFWQPLGIF